MNDTVDALKKEVARYKEYVIKEQTYIEELEVVRYQNALLMGRLEQAEINETILSKEVSISEEKITTIELQKNELFKQKKKIEEENAQLKVKERQYVEGMKGAQTQIEACLKENSKMKNDLDQA